MKRLLFIVSFCFYQCSFLLTAVENISSFKHSVHTEKKPWTDKDFLNNPKDFQFAIVADRTGGPRAGVFPKAVSKLNELRPEFVITVGDLIQGGAAIEMSKSCLLYTSPSPRDGLLSRMPSSA